MMTTVLKKNINLHILSLIIFSIYYLFSFIVFETVVINSHDNLEIDVVSDRVISKILLGDFNSYKIFLSGEFKWHYLDRIFYPINLLNTVLSDKQFYFFQEITEKVISYFSFYLLGKFLFKNKTYSILGALFYATLVNDISYPAPTIFMPFMPYLLYLLISKDQFRLKHLAIIFFVGLNSSLVFDYLPMITMIIFAYFIRSQKNYKILFSFMVTLSLSMIIAGIPLIISVLGEPLQRTTVTKEGLLNIITMEINYLHRMLLPNKMQGIFDLPVNLLKLLILVSCFFLKNKKINLFLLFFFLIYLSKILVSSDFSQIIFNNFLVFLKGFNFSRIGNVMPLLFSILLIGALNVNKKKIFKNFLITLIITSAVLNQLYVPTNEFTKIFLKENLKKESLKLLKEKYKNVSIKEIIDIVKVKENFKHKNIVFDLKTNNSFDSFFKFNAYKKIKLLVGSKRVASIGANPMIAAMNDINVIDGYHTVYHLSYKKKFRKIIAKELDQNNTLKDYYDNWSNRVFMFYSDENNLLFDFGEAKNLGAAFIISSFPIKNEGLESNCLLCDKNNKIYLYKII